VLLASLLDTDQITAIEQWLRSTCESMRGPTADWEVRFDGTTFGCSSDEACPIQVQILGPGPDGYRVSRLADMDLDSVCAALGYVPPQEILVFGFCGGIVNHCLVGRIALHLARQFGGTICLYGQVRALDARGDSSTDEARTFMASVGGTFWEFCPDGPNSAPCAVVDVLFLQKWLRHPEFHLL
jgi:hypothetical protein